jgi:hypothetical protein
MIQLIRSIVFAITAVGSIAVYGNDGNKSTFRTDVSCKEALANVRQVKVGTTDSKVLVLLSQPTDIAIDVWGYNFWDCSPRPRVGEQLIIGVAFTFKDGVVSKIDYATICATGFVPRS